MKKIILLAFIAVSLSGCAMKKHIYKVTFGDGTYDYYELRYKPKPNAKSIEYEGETILGIVKLEELK